MAKTDVPKSSEVAENEALADVYQILAQLAGGSTKPYDARLALRRWLASLPPDKRGDIVANKRNIRERMQQAVECLSGEIMSLMD